jgi:hypothetical protein
MGSRVPDNEVHKGPAHDNLVKERLRIDTAQSCESCILDRIEVRILAYPQGILGEQSMVDFTSAEPNA